MTCGLCQNAARTANPVRHGLVLKRADDVRFGDPIRKSCSQWTPCRSRDRIDQIAFSKRNGATANAFNAVSPQSWLPTSSVLPVPVFTFHIALYTPRLMGREKL